MTLPLACSIDDPLDGLWFLAREFMGPRDSKECAARLGRGDNHLREGRAAAAEKKLQGGNEFPLAAEPRRSPRSMITSSVQAMIDLHKLSGSAPGPLLRAVALGRSGGASCRRSARRDHIVAPHITRLHPRRAPSINASIARGMSTFPDRNNFPLLEDRGRLMECAAHEGLRGVAHDFRPDGSWQRPLAQSLPR